MPSLVLIGPAVRPAIGNRQTDKQTYRLLYVRFPRQGIARFSSRHVTWFAPIACMYFALRITMATANRIHRSLRIWGSIFQRQRRDVETPKSGVCEMIYHSRLGWQGKIRSAWEKALPLHRKTFAILHCWNWEQSLWVVDALVYPTGENVSGHASRCYWNLRPQLTIVDI